MTEPVVPIIFQDEQILIINKPSGLLTLPDGFHPEISHVRSLLEPAWGRLWIVHRLDKETSGVLLLARNASTHKTLNDQFARREIRKKYDALVLGIPNRDQWEINLPLRIDGDRQHRTVVDFINGKPAMTNVKLLETLPSNLSLLSVAPYTGYTHQIRAHLAACGLPIGGDHLYQAKPHPAIDIHLLGTYNPDDSVIFSRLMLHAREIQFTHPVSGESLMLIASYPSDFMVPIDRLR